MAFSVDIWRCRDRMFYTRHTYYIGRRIAGLRIKPWSRATKDALIAEDWRHLSDFGNPRPKCASASLGTTGCGERLLVPGEIETLAVPALP